jgi:hypothetical protein
MSIEIPNIEDKIYQLFAEILKQDLMCDEELRIYVDNALELNGMTMDKLIHQLLIGVEAGYSIEQQFNIIKQIFNVK